MPAPSGVDLAFGSPLAMSDGAALALEDYARAVTQSQEAAALRPEDDPTRVRGVRVTAPQLTVSPALVRDIEDFARTLTFGRDGPGLGWS
jgi:hypothetical protein